MKTKMALLALALILTFGITANVATSAVVATLGVSTTPITLNAAGLGTTPNHIDVKENPGVAYISYLITSQTPISVNSMTLSIFDNGNMMSTETYNSFDIAGRLIRYGYDGTTVYGSGSMSVPIIDIWGTAGTPSVYTASLNPGDVWTAKMDFNVQGQGVITSSGVITYVPEPTVSILTILSTLCFLRRKRGL